MYPQNMELFSHPLHISNSAAADTGGARIPVYVSIPMSGDELWLAFTEYTHLWWPALYKRSEDSYLEFGEKYFLEDTDDGVQHILAETQYFQPGDVLALNILPRELDSAFEGGLSFVFDEEEQVALVDICSGIIKPRELDDGAELGVLEADLPAAREILGAFARFVQATLTVED